MIADCSCAQPDLLSLHTLNASSSILLPSCGYLLITQDAPCLYSCICGLRPLYPLTAAPTVHPLAPPALCSSYVWNCSCSVIYIMPGCFCFLLWMMYVKWIMHCPLMSQSDYWPSWPFLLPSMSHLIKMNSTAFLMIRERIVNYVSMPQVKGFLILCWNPTKHHSHLQPKMIEALQMLNYLQQRSHLEWMEELQVVENKLIAEA